MINAPTVEELQARASMDEAPDLRLLFHRLNNQLGIVLANAELLESKATDPAARARAAQIVASALDAMATARELRALQNRTSASDL
jgi:two-component sensor histidine kinase